MYFPRSARQRDVLRDAPPRMLGVRRPTNHHGPLDPHSFDYHNLLIIILISHYMTNLLIYINTDYIAQELWRH
jgi:hypothetical protein